jgi:hypothetical protein
VISIWLKKVLFPYFDDNFTHNLPHMEFEGSISLVSRKMIFFIADLHVCFRTFYSKKYDLSDNFFFRLSRAVAAVVGRNLSRH